MIKNTILNAVIGYPLEHTLSPKLHNALYKAAGLNAVLLPLEKENLAKLVETIRFLSVELTAVTMPFKRDILGYLDFVDEEAKTIGAVNTVILKNGKLNGYNTDIVGIRAALKGVNLKDKKVLLLGAGGVALPVAHVIKTAGGRLLVWNRDSKKAEVLIKNVFGPNSKQAEIVSLDQLTAKDVDVIINATPVGMFPNVNESPLNLSLLAAHQVVFDLVYRPMKTKLLLDAESKGAKTILGITMFIAQALEQIRLWSGKNLSGLISENELISLLSDSK